MSEPASRRTPMMWLRRERETVPVLSPFPDKDSRARPRWYERIRGLVGMSVLVVGAGVLLALSVGLALLALAIFVATSFS